MDTSIPNLGPGTVPSPMGTARGGDSLFVTDSARILYCDEFELPEGESPRMPAETALELAGPRRMIYFSPDEVRTGIVTCGGLCPGINDVIRAVVLSLWHNYGIRKIHGFRNGYQGLIESYGHEVLPLDPETVDGWQDLGGTKLGSSRGAQAPAAMIDTLKRMGVNILFTIGGDGTLRGAQDLCDEIERQGLKIAVVAIPKTIDNDILHIDESFGFQSACEAALGVLRCAHVEAKGVPNGIGLVKLMGRQSGFIASQAALAMSDVNFVLIPEVPFVLDGEGGFLNALEKRIRARQHAVVVVAEGAGQDLMRQGTEARDASGNVVFQDVGVFLKKRIEEYFAARALPGRVRYIDPSYAIRGVPGNATDSVYCLQLGHDAVHAAMAGKTRMLVGRRHGRIVHMPLEMVTRGRKQVNPEGRLWQMVLEATGQARWFR